MLKVDHLAIVGGGFSGTLLAINLLRYGTMRVTLIEQRKDHLARGLAFGSAQADHVLNVRAGNMSAFPDQPGHFSDWLERHHVGTAQTFATRQIYGEYLLALLEDARRASSDRMEIILGRAIDMRVDTAQCQLTLESGAKVDADMVVLAPGNLPPHRLAAFRHLNAPAYINEPWSTHIADGLKGDDRILLLGSGLTAVDCAQSLDAAGFRGRIVALSRRGLLPHRHDMTDPFAPLKERPTGSCSTLVRSIRNRAAEVEWRNAVDEIRPFTQDIWRAAAPDMRMRFLRHLRPYWDIHRHRVAPQVADRIGRMMNEGRLEILAGKIVAARASDGGVNVTWRPRGSASEVRMQCARAINCTGPLSDLSAVADPLLGRLAASGLIRADAHAIGIDVDQQNRAITFAGTAQDRVRVVGPMTRGAHWEIVAVPDIRRQTWNLARTLSGAHWVEAEGL